MAAIEPTSGGADNLDAAPPNVPVTGLQMSTSDGELSALKISSVSSASHEELEVAKGQEEEDSDEEEEAIFQSRLPSRIGVSNRLTHPITTYASVATNTFSSSFPQLPTASSNMPTATMAVPVPPVTTSSKEIPALSDVVVSRSKSSKSRKLRALTPTPPSSRRRTPLDPILNGGGSNHNNVHFQPAAAAMSSVIKESLAPISASTSIKKVDSNGEDRRKATPPDLLQLSNMYFDRRQKLMLSDRAKFISESAHSMRGKSNLVMSSDNRPSTTPENVVVGSPNARNMPRKKKLAPLTDGGLHKPSLEEARIRIGEKFKTHGLHLSVNFSSNNGWKNATEGELKPMKAKPFESNDNFEDEK